MSQYKGPGHYTKIQLNKNPLRNQNEELSQCLKEVTPTLISKDNKNGRRFDNLKRSSMSMMNP